MKVSQSKSEVFENSKVELDCTAEGFPVPDVEWYKDGKPVDTQIKSQGESTLLIPNAKESDSGRYTCYATNSVNIGKYEVRTFADLQGEAYL